MQNALHYIDAATRIASVLLACITGYFAYKSLKLNVKSIDAAAERDKFSLENHSSAIERESINLKTNMHIQFQKEIRSIQKALPYSVNDPNWEPSIDHRRQMALYWYIVFDEWFTCSTHPELNDLWDKYYSNGVRSALRNKHFKDEAYRLLSENVTLLGQGENFRRVINAIYRLDNPEHDLVPWPPQADTGLASPPLPTATNPQEARDERAIEPA